MAIIKGKGSYIETILRRIRIDMRYTFKNSGVLNIGETVKSIGREEYSKRYRHAVPMALSKLGELEDIEEELGIDLIVLVKALKQGGVYVKSGPEVDWTTPMQGFQICGDKTNGVTLWSQVRLDPKDYGKTWALSKEELE